MQPSLQSSLASTLVLSFLLLTGCEAPGPVYSDKPHPSARPGGGIVELDENTEPRFVRSVPADTIGLLRTAGGNVFLNGVRVKGPITMPNNGFVRTGQSSGARIDFRTGTHGCLIRALDFRSGRLYGESGRCAQQVETGPGAVHTNQRGTAYQVALFGQRAQVTVLHGTVDVWVWARPTDRRSVHAYQEAVLTPTSIQGPRDVLRSDARSRTDWRRKFNFFRSSQREESCKRYADISVQQNADNLRRSCGFTGATWSSNYGVHYDWCMRGDNWRTAAPREEATRKSSLAQCRTTVGKTVPPVVGDAVVSVLKSILQRRPQRSQPPRPSAGTNTGSGHSVPSSPPSNTNQSGIHYRQSTVPPNPVY